MEAKDESVNLRGIRAGFCCPDFKYGGQKIAPRKQKRQAIAGLPFRNF